MTYPVYACTEVDTGQVTFYNLPEKHGHVYLVRLYIILGRSDKLATHNLLKKFDPKNAIKAETVLNVGIFIEFDIKRENIGSRYICKLFLQKILNFWQKFATVHVK